MNENLLPKANLEGPQQVFPGGNKCPETKTACWRVLEGIIV